MKLDNILERRLACLAISVACIHCGDAGGDGTATSASSSGDTSAASTDDPGTTVPTTGEEDTTAASTADASSDATSTGETGDETTGDTTGDETTGAPMPASCVPAQLPGPIADGHWDPRFTVGGLGGPDGDAPHVADFARDEDGSVLAAGRFRWLGAERIKPLLRSPAGAPDSGAWTSAKDTWELSPEPFGGFSAVAVGPAGELALATTGFAPAIWVDSGAGLEVVGELSGPTDLGFVRALAWYDGRLWAAGNFSLLGSDIAYLAAWDGDKWSAAPNGEANAPVSELLVAQDRLYVGGGFDDIGGISARRVAAWDGATWEAFDMDWPQAGVVASLALDADDDLVAGGRFSDQPQDDCPTRGSIAEWNGAEWTLLGQGVSQQDAICGSYAGFVYDIALHQGELYITGSFSHANGPVDDPAATPARNFARWHAGKWESLDGGAPESVDSPWVPFGNESAGIVGQRLFSDGERLLAGILAPGVADVPSSGLIAYQGGQWALQAAAPQLAVHSSTGRFAVGGPDCALHVIGTMSHLEGEPLASSVLRWEADGWTPVGAKVPATWNCQHGAAVGPDGTVFAGCAKTDGEGAEVLALVDDAWTSIGAPAAPGRVLALEIDPRGALWAVGGVIGEVDKTPSGFVARRDGDAWTLISTAINGPVTHIDFAPDDDGTGEPRFVVGGRFTQLEGASHARVAQHDGTAWVALGAGLKTSLSALAYGRHGIYASGTLDGQADALTVGRWDGAAWVELATADHGFPELVVAGVVDLIEVGTSLVVMGSLYDGQFPPAARNVLVFDGREFDWLAGGVAATFTYDAAVTSEGLWFSGGIAEAGVDPARVASVGVAHYRWTE